MITTEFEFEELVPKNENGREIDGILLRGVAELEEADPTCWPHEFFVVSVTIDGGGIVRFNDARSRPNSFDGVMFRLVANELENSKTELGELAQIAFSDAVEATLEDA